MKNLLRNKNKIALYGIIIAVLAVCVWAVMSRPAPQKKTVDTDKDQSMDYMGNKIVEEKNGKKIWEITAETITMDPDTKKAAMKNITGKYYDDNGKTLTLTAPEGTYDDVGKDIILDKGVHVEGDDGLVFDSQKVSWSSEKQLFTGEGSVKIKKGDMTAEGDTIESSNAFTQFKLTGNAHIVKGSAAN